MFFISILVVSIITPISIIDSNEDDIIEVISNSSLYFTNDASTIHSNFSDFVKQTTKNLDIVISLPKAMCPLPQDFIRNLSNSFHDQISVRIIFNVNSSCVNKEDFNYKNVKIKHFKTTKEHNEDDFFINFAISDRNRLFFPSTFNFTSVLNIYYYIYTCNFNDEDLNLQALFDFLWYQKTDSSFSMFHPYIRQYKNQSILYAVEPVSEFLINLSLKKRLTSTIAYSFSQEVTVLSHSIFQNPTKIGDDAEKRKVFAQVLHAFEVPLEYITDCQIKLFVPRKHYVKYPDIFSSMISNMQSKSAFTCSNSLDGTAIFYKRENEQRAMLFPAGINKVFKSSFIMGIFGKVGDNFNLSWVSNTILNNSYCQPLNKPYVGQ